MTTIFISSTYVDLIPHRKKVIEAIKSAGWRSVDMESFNARSDDPQSECFEEIADADIFVGIYAYRYGYVPDEAATSITQREYEHARDRGKPILCYVVEKGHPWDPDMLSEGEDKKRLSAFKEMIEKTRTVKYFTTPDDLAAKVVGGIVQELEKADKRHAGQRLILNDQAGTADVLKGIGVDPVATFAAHAEDLRIQKKIDRGETVRAGDLRTWLLRHGSKDLASPREISVLGVLQPYVLMHSGWWEEGDDNEKPAVRGLQEWLYHGLQEWAPSWGYAWELDSPETLNRIPFHLGQIADDMCDEAESIPVYIPAAKAMGLSNEFHVHPGGLRVELTGFLAHRKHFCPKLNIDPDTRNCAECPQQPECLIDTRFGGTLDFCLIIDRDARTHGIRILGPAQFYSGYLWKCLVPQQWVGDPALATLRESFFIWEHTNFADEDTRAFNLDSLVRKQEFLEKKYGPMHLIQKSSLLVPGEPAVPSSQFYRQLLRYKKV